MKHPVRSFIGHTPADEVVLLGVKKVVLKCRLLALIQGIDCPENTANVFLNPLQSMSA